MRNTVFKPCSVAGCGGNASSYAQGGRGYCNRHLSRWRRHGDPFGGRTPEGEPERYFREVVLNYDGDDCLPWPYAKIPRGYGHLWHDGRLQLVSRLVCEEEYGPPPTAEHEAAHSCGKGREGCVTKRHLSWKTPHGNAADRLTHGTQSRGERQGRSKLTEADIHTIRDLKGVVVARELAERFGVCITHVYNIQTGRSWRYLETTYARVE